MTNKHLFNELGGIDKGFVLEAAPNEKSKNSIIRNKSFFRLAVACFAIVLIATGIFIGLGNGNTENAVYAATVCLDVNPGIELNIDDNNKVIDVFAANQEARTVIGSLDFEGMDIEDAVNSLVASLIENGYLTEATNIILLTIESENDMNELEGKLAASITRATSDISGEVMIQKMQTRVEVEDIIEKYGITAGKAKLVKDIAEKYPETKVEELAVMSITELSKLVSSKKDEAFGNIVINLKGESPKEGYLTPEEALKILLDELMEMEPETFELISVDLTGRTYTFAYQYMTFNYKGSVVCTVDAITGKMLCISSTGGGRDDMTTIGLDEASNIAIEYLNRDNPVSIYKVYTETGEYYGIPHYIVKAYSRDNIAYTVTVNAMTGEILESECSEHYVPNVEDYITEEQAVEIALATVPALKGVDKDQIESIYPALIADTFYYVYIHYNGQLYTCPINALTGVPIF